MFTMNTYTLVSSNDKKYFSKGKYFHISMFYYVLEIQYILFVSFLDGEGKRIQKVLIVTSEFDFLPILAILVHKSNIHCSISVDLLDLHKK